MQKQIRLFRARANAFSRKSKYSCYGDECSYVYNLFVIAHKYMCNHVSLHACNDNYKIPFPEGLVAKLFALTHHLVVDFLVQILPLLGAFMNRQISLVLRVEHFKLDTEGIPCFNTEGIPILNSIVSQ